VLKEYKVLKGYQVTLVLREVHKVLRVLLVHRELRELRVLKEVLQDHKEP
jgi:hypothetical protein